MVRLGNLKVIDGNLKGNWPCVVGTYLAGGVHGPGLGLL